MGGAFGAIGDHVLWGTWRPFCAVMALSVGLLVGYPTADGEWLEPSIYNAQRVHSLRQVVDRWILKHVQFDPYLDPLARPAKGDHGRPTGGPLDRIAASSEVGRANPARRPAFHLLFTMVLVYFSHWSGVGAVALDGRGPFGLRDTSSMGPIDVCDLLFGLRRFGRDDDFIRIHWP